MYLDLPLESGSKCVLCTKIYDVEDTKPLNTGLGATEGVMESKTRRKKILSFLKEASPFGAL